MIRKHFHSSFKTISSFSFSSIYALFSIKKDIQIYMLGGMGVGGIWENFFL